MSGFARRGRLRTRAVAGLVVIAVSLGVGAVGCGSGAGGSDESSGSATSTGVGVTTAKSPEVAVTAGKAASPRVSQSKPPATPRASGASTKGAAKDVSRVPAPTPRHLRAVGRKAAKDCPAGLDSAQCGALVEGFVRAKAKKEKGVAPQPVQEPRDCLNTMSQANCEAMLTAQKAAAENAQSPVEVEECLRNPTPHCEAVLRQMFEAQYVASQEAEK